ncbi:hypothetical protein [Spirosoma areae]
MLVHTPLQKNSRLTVFTLLIGLLMVLPLLGYIFFIGHLHQNLPIFDDYVVQLELTRLNAAPTLLGKLSVLFSQLNEHRIAYTRFWFWLIHALNGTISYSALTVVGNLSLVGIWAFLTWLLLRAGNTWLAVIPLSWILFQVNYYENSLWGMASLQNLTVHALYPLLFGLVTSPRRWPWMASWGVAVLLCFTSGNGFIALVLAAGALLYQRRWRDLVVWAVLTAGLVLVYFGAYKRPAAFPVSYTDSFFDKVKATFLFLGPHVDCYFQSSTYRYHLLNGLLVCLPVLALTAWSSWQLWQSWRSQKPLTQPQRVLLITILMVGFIGLSAGAAVENRLSFSGWTGLLEGRYRLYSTMLVLTGYVQLMVVFSRQQWVADRLAWIALGVSVLMWVGIFRRQVGNAYLFQNRVLTFYQNWTQVQPPATQQLIATVFTPSGEEAALVAKLTREIAPNPATYPLQDQLIPTLVEDSEKYSIENRQVPNSQLPNEWNMVILWADDHYLLFPVYRFPNPDGRSFWLNQTWFVNGYRTDLFKTFMPAKRYQAGFLTLQNGQLTIYRTSRILTP